MFSSYINKYKDHGVVLGIDVGWNEKKPTTGICILEWDKQQIRINLLKAEADYKNRRKKINQITQGKRLLAVGIDGPLVPNFKLVTKYRSAEALLSRGKFQKRGKPGPTNSPIGQELHRHATKIAKLVVDTQEVALATYPYKVHDKAIVEAFPNAFLSVLYPDSRFDTGLIKRPWTDFLFRRLENELIQLIITLLPKHKLNFEINSIKDHDEIAAFICALTALCSIASQSVALGDSELGYIVLPPIEYWGTSQSSSSKWAEDTLRNNIVSVQREFHDVIVYMNNKQWIP